MLDFASFVIQLFELESLLSVGLNRHKWCQAHLGYLVVCSTLGGLRKIAW